MFNVQNEEQLAVMNPDEVCTYIFTYLEDKCKRLFKGT